MQTCSAWDLKLGVEGAEGAEGSERAPLLFLGLTLLLQHILYTSSSSDICTAYHTLLCCIISLPPLPPLPAIHE